MSMIYSDVMPCEYRIVRDLEKDAWNWYDACNKTGHGVDWKQRIDDSIAANIVGKTRGKAFDFLLPYLDEKWKSDGSCGLGEQFIRERFEANFELACRKLETITGKSLYRNDFTIYLTTFPRGPYDYENGAFWLCVYWINPIANFMHEMLHFQFIHYWRENESSKISQLSNEDFEVLKESLTVVLDNELIPLIEKADRGYEIHQELRNKLHDFWISNKDFAALIDYGVECISRR